jgi:hypothetical protein
MTNPPSSPEAPLQFDRAVTKDGGSLVPGVVCSTCNHRITDRYWTLGDQPTCISCKARLTREAADAKKLSVYGWSAFYGFGAALGGAILYYAVLKILNLEMALVAIAIGYMVGYAMRKGANGWGGRRYQLTAAALTYLSVGMAYVPLVMEGARDEAKSAAKAAADSLAIVQAGAVDATDSSAVVDSTLIAVADSTVSADSAVVSDSSAAADSTAAPADSAAAPAVAKDGGASSGFLKVVLGFAAVFFFALTLPIMYIIGTLPGGLISALILGFGIRKAWRMTAGNDLTFNGPLTIPK